MSDEDLTIPLDDLIPWEFDPCRQRMFAAVKVEAPLMMTAVDYITLDEGAAAQRDTTMRALIM